MKQNYKNHKRFYPLFHFFTIPLIALGFALSCLNEIRNGKFTEILLIVLFLLLGIVAVMARVFALKAQDRAARADERLRYYILTQKRLPDSLTMTQLLALRFASDEEFIDLVDQTVKQNLSSTEIKKLIKNWKGDYHRI